MTLRVAKTVALTGFIIASAFQMDVKIPDQKGHPGHESKRKEEVQNLIRHMPVTVEALVNSEIYLTMERYYTNTGNALNTFKSVTVMKEGSSSTFLAKAAGLVLCIFGIMYAYSQAHEEIGNRTGLKLAHVCCIVYATLSISIDLSIKNAAVSYGGHFPFHPACGVIVVEYAKCAVSIVLFAYTLRQARADGTQVVWPRQKDVAWLAVPAAIYAMNNVIVFKAIQSCPLSTFGVLRETMLIWNALIWCATFQQSISPSRWLAIGGIFLGCSINQIPKMLEDEWTPGVFWAMLLAFCNAAGAVANEYAMKQRASVDINLQNCILYTMCGSFVLFGLAIVSPSHVQSTGAFFKGFVPECWQVIILQAFTGLAVSRILKYVEAVTKTIVAAIRGPGVIFFGAVIFNTKLGVSEVLATLMVCLSCWWYLRQGPLKQPPAAPKEVPPSESTPLQQQKAPSA